MNGESNSIPTPLQHQLIKSKSNFVNKRSLRCSYQKLQPFQNVGIVLPKVIKKITFSTPHLCKHHGKNEKFHLTD